MEHKMPRASLIKMYVVLEKMKYYRNKAATIQTVGSYCHTSLISMHNTVAIHRLPNCRIPCRQPEGAVWCMLCWKQVLAAGGMNDVLRDWILGKLVIVKLEAHPSSSSSITRAKWANSPNSAHFQNEEALPLHYWRAPFFSARPPWLANEVRRRKMVGPLGSQDCCIHLPE